MKPLDALIIHPGQLKVWVTKKNAEPSKRNPKMNQTWVTKRGIGPPWASKGVIKMFSSSWTKRIRWISWMSQNTTTNQQALWKRASTTAKTGKLETRTRCSIDYSLRTWKITQEKRSRETSRTLWRILRIKLRERWYRSRIFTMVSGCSLRR